MQSLGRPRFVQHSWALKLGELVLDDALEAPLLHRRESSGAIVLEELDNRGDVCGIAN